MPELSRKIKYVIDLNAPLIPGTLSGVMMEGDDRADTIEVRLMNGMGPVAASSVALAAVANVTNNDGQTLVNAGTVGDVISIPLDARCYSVPGRVKIRVQLTDNAGVDRTIMTVWGTVEANGEGVAIDPGGNLPSYADLLVIKQEMQQATQAAADAKNAANTAAGAANTAANAANAATSEANGAAVAANEAATAANSAATDAKNASDYVYDLVQNTPLGGLSFAINADDGGLDVTYTYTE